jgi:hypothetical protein
MRMRKRSSSCNVRAEEIAGHVSASTRGDTDAGRQSAANLVRQIEEFVCWLRSPACSMWRIKSTSQSERRAENLCLEQMETAMKP